ncbi:hypothetical protein DFQ28_008879 [Apophysomyces sp. BC1034]|nr:hypothetical protein DFQ30_005235 [Apophysomyces sp. BC1015]KAG0183390.1 hypothetical protein DFQ29_005766 [Apophysomyces sp. BC1021]KAG0194620.1 hypothetical protein DFQ28_008879 [Apophysomyces sp. BC1034]
MSRFKRNRAQKPQSSSKKSKEPETFEEYIEEAISFEEQGERYATGDRAQRNFERAADMYSKAHAVNETDADSCTEPEKKLERVDMSITKFRKALQLEQNKTDAQFNLGQALHLRSEVLQETTEIDNPYNQSAIEALMTALQEAISLFENVYQLQEKEYKACQSDIAESQQPREEQKHEEHNHEEHKHEEHKHEEHKHEESQSAEDYTTVTEVEPTTAFSLVDTLVSTAETMTTMASMLASFQASMDLFSRARTKLSLAEKWLLSVPEGAEHKQARIQIYLKEAQNFASMADRSFLASSQVDHTLFGQAIERLDEIIEQFDAKHVEAMCDRGDILTSYAQALLEFASKSNTPLAPETSGKEIWQLYAQATKSFQTALTIEPKNCSILNKLGDVSIARARLELPVAERNKAQLLKNAEFYFKQAVDINKEVLTSGWIGWAFAAWAQETWLNAKGKKAEATKIINTWIKRGGDEDMFRNGAEDNETLDEEFVDWVCETFFDEDEDEDED